MTILICILILVMYEFEKRRLFGDEGNDEDDPFVEKDFDCQEYTGHASDSAEVSEIWKILFFGFIVCSFVLYFS